MATLNELRRASEEDEVSRSPSSQPDEKATDGPESEPIQRIHAKTIVLLIVGTILV